MRILITGAAGKVGRALRKELAAAGHKLVLADVCPIENPEGRSLRLDISDGEAVRRAMRGIDAVAHLAFGKFSWRKPVQHFARAFDVNAKGTHYLLWAASRAGVKRFVYTSTLSVFGSTVRLGQMYVTERTKPDPEEVYGLTKYLGEECCRFAARNYGLSVVCLRLCNVVDDAGWQQAQKFRSKTEWSRYWLNMATHVDDVARAIHRALVVPKIRYEVIHIASNNKGRLTSIHRAKKLLGFWPKHRLRR